MYTLADELDMVAAAGHAAIQDAAGSAIRTRCECGQWDGWTDTSEMPGLHAHQAHLVDVLCVAMGWTGQVADRVRALAGHADVIAWELIAAEACDPG